MKLSSMTWIGRAARQAVTVGVLALVLSALAASPAAANQRGDAVTEANNFIHVCFSVGETPHGMASNDKYINVHCAYGNGSIKSCEWDAANGWNMQCWWTHPWDVRNPEGDDPGIDLGDTLNPGRAASLDAGSGDSNDSKHDKKKGKDNGKKHGKSKNHKGGQRK